MILSMISIKLFYQWFRQDNFTSELRQDDFTSDLRQDDFTSELTKTFINDFPNIILLMISSRWFYQWVNHQDYFINDFTKIILPIVSPRWF